MTQYSDQPWDSEPTPIAPPSYPPRAQQVGYGAAPYGAAPYGGTLHGYPPAGYGAVAPPNSSGAVTVMVLGIVSVAALALCPVVGLIPAIVGLVMAGNATREIEESRGMLVGQGMITAGRIMSWSTIGLHALAVVGFVLFFVLISAAGTTTTS